MVSVLQLAPVAFVAVALVLVEYLKTSGARQRNSKNSSLAY